ncbi:MAG: hypothetical protein J6Y02_14630 [Pseudobutyrivibrio sp.]|nr:hypothetical protein [Pseudobutyrivibrio sp.]
MSKIKAKMTPIKQFYELLKTWKPEAKLLISVDIGDDGFPVTHADIRIATTAHKPVLTLHYDTKFPNTLTVQDMITSIDMWADNNERFKDIRERSDTVLLLHVENHLFHMASFMNLSGTDNAIRINAYAIEEPKEG